MSAQLRKGQKIDLTKNNPNLSQLSVNLDWQADSSIELDVSAFLLNSTGKVASDDDFVFYGNPNHFSNSVKVQGNAINIDLSRVPSNVEKIAVTLTIYSKHNFSQVRNSIIKVNDILSFNFGQELSTETAIVVAEIYRYKGEWKFNAVGAGFNGGLEALCKNFGVEVSDSTPPPITQSSKSTQTTNTNRKPMKLDPPSKNSSINSNKTTSPPPPKKVELKKGQKISLVKTGQVLGEIVINLNWSQPRNNQRSSGFFSQIFGPSSDGIDLDLACLYELKNGDKGVVQALGNCFGNLNNPPYIALDGDDRTGSNAAGETIRVNGKYVDKIKRILVFTFIYEGIANWREADGVVTVKCPGSPDIIVRMDEYGSDLPNCGIALLENQGGTFSVEKIVKFYPSTRYLDEDFGWGLRWVSGRK